MNKITLALVALVLLIGGFFILNNYVNQEKQVDTEESETTETAERDVHLSQFEDQSLGITFDYPEGDDGYVVDDVTESVGGEVEGVEVVKAYRLMNRQEKLELENSEGGREGPPVIQLMVFRNSLEQSAGLWVNAFPRFSNIGMIRGEVDREIMVDGVEAVEYTTDGLYMTNNVVVAKDDFVYHFTGSYLEPGSFIHQDFKAVVDSVRFISEEGAEGEVNGGADDKIDVRVACESALAYMLFETGEQADQFIAECVAGEHPEVIERYINDMGLDGATI